MPDNLEMRRDRELLGRKSSKDYQDALKTFRRIQDGFRDQAQRSDDIIDFWAIYNCEIDGNNYYNGNSDIYVPIVHDAVQAIKTRLVNQLFPASGRYIDASSSDYEVPHSIVALLEDYVQKTHLRTRYIAPLIRNGMIEGHYNLYLDWNRTSRHIVSRETTRPPIALPGMPRPIDELDVTPEPIERIAPEEVFDQFPSVEVIHDTDVLVDPPTAASVDDALAKGGTVTIIRRWTKETLEAMMDQEEIRRGPTKELLELSQREGSAETHRIEKDLIDAAGIRGGGKFFQGYEVWQVRDIPGEGRRLTKSLYGGYDLILSCRRNPMWNDRCQLISVPREKQAGAFKGMSPIKPGVASMQYYANQIAQQAADSATLSMVPIIMTDPAKNPNTAGMILNMGVIWKVDPNSTRFAEFPKLWQDGIPILQNLQAQIFQSLGVNPGMLPQQSGRPGAKRNQAEVALEQQVDILTTQEQSAVLEDDILTPTVTMWAEYDHQFRDDEVSVRTYGELGHAATIEKVPLLQSTTRYHFRWFGIEQSRNAATNQQRIALINVAMAPAMSQALAKHGKQVDPSAALESAFGELFGWRQGRKIIVDMSAKMAMMPDLENQMLEDGFDVPVHMLDDDVKHIQVHRQLLQSSDQGVASRTRDHIQRHMMSMQVKATAMSRSQGMPAPGGAQPGQGQAGGGGASSPAPGGAAPAPRPMRGPAGMIHPDQMPRAGAAVMPRKM